MASAWHHVLAIHLAVGLHTVSCLCFAFARDAQHFSTMHAAGIQPGPSCSKPSLALLITAAAPAYWVALCQHDYCSASCLDAYALVVLVADVCVLVYLCADQHVHHCLQVGPVTSLEHAAACGRWWTLHTWTTVRSQGTIAVTPC